jgi:hypothetical protein
MVVFLFHVHLRLSFFSRTNVTNLVPATHKYLTLRVVLNWRNSNF